MLTKEQIDKYVKTGGISCPYCNSDNLDWCKSWRDDEYFCQQVVCQTCHKEWTNISITKLIDIM
jgi:DNA-directed RNA polymerase subunit RPC12/RpoP